MDWELSSRHLLCGFVPVIAVLVAYCKWRPTSAAFAELIGRDAERAAAPLF